MECPNCHATNDSSSSVCVACKTPFPLNDATFLGGANPDENATFAGEGNPGDQTDLGGAQGWSQPVAPPKATDVLGGRLRNGMHLGKRYEIVQMLGEGGMGAVYKARDVELDRLVALKVIRPELAVHEEILQRFKQELILARKITQKNVIRIFDLGEADGVKFITMEFIEGKDLTSLIKEKGRLSFEECADVIFQTCTALDAAHAEGVVHRDLKPQNIMVEKSGRIIVMDFGIARTMEQGAGMTHTGALIGTPDYMSPEQVMGEHVDARSDLFTLGIIFYQLLVGQLPYKADTLQGAMYKRTREKPKAPAEVDPTVPALLSDIAAKCMQMEPAQRYQGALEIQKDIYEWRGGSTKRIELPVEKEPAPAAPPRSRVQMMIAGAALVAVVWGGVYVARKYRFEGERHRWHCRPSCAATFAGDIAVSQCHFGSEAGLGGTGDGGYAQHGRGAIVEFADGIFGARGAGDEGPACDAAGEHGRFDDWTHRDAEQRGYRGIRKLRSTRGSHSD